MACEAQLKLVRDPLVTDVRWRFKQRTYCDDAPSLTITDHRKISDIFNRTCIRLPDGSAVVPLSGFSRIVDSLDIDLKSPYVQDEFVQKYLPQLCPSGPSGSNPIPIGAEENEVEAEESKESLEEAGEADEAKSSEESKEGDEVIPSEIDTTELNFSFDEVLSFISYVYAPVYSFGKELRRAVLRADAEAIQQLIARGCNPSKLDGEGMNAAHYAAESGSVEGLESVLEAWPKLALDEGDRCGWTPFLIAASRGHLHFLRNLLRKGGDFLSSRTRQGRNALHCAVLKGRAPVVKFLLQQKKSLRDEYDKSSLGVLHFAAMNGDEHILDLLLASGANRKATDALGRTYLDYLSEE